MSELALITGGTSGIGAAFANALAEDRIDLVLVARQADRLESEAARLREHYGVNVEVISADLGSADDIARVEARLTDEAQPVTLLVNNAGFGRKGTFTDISVEDHVAMLRVNGEAVLRLTHAALKAMVPRHHGGVINVSSVAAYTPGVRPSSTYAATKAFVSALSEGLAPSLIGTGVHLSAVHPGFVRTEFHDRAGIATSKLPKSFWLEPSYVARAALTDHRAGRLVSIPGLPYKVIMHGVRFIPRSLVRKASRLVGGKKH